MFCVMHKETSANAYLDTYIYTWLDKGIILIKLHDLLFYIFVTWLLFYFITDLFVLQNLTNGMKFWFYSKL